MSRASTELVTQELEDFAEMEKKLLGIQGIISDPTISANDQELFLTKKDAKKGHRFKIFDQTLYIDRNSDSEESSDDSIKSVNSDIIEQAQQEVRKDEEAEDEDGDDFSYDDYEEMVTMLSHFGITDKFCDFPELFTNGDFDGKDFSDVFREFKEESEKLSDNFNLSDVLADVYSKIDQKDFNENDYFIRVFGPNSQNTKFLFHYNFNLLWVSAKRRDLRLILRFISMSRRDSTYCSIQLSTGHILVSCSSKYYLMPAESRRIFFHFG